MIVTIADLTAKTDGLSGGARAKIKTRKIQTRKGKI